MELQDLARCKIKRLNNIQAMTEGNKGSPFAL
jgi:hypothetical protein